MIDVIGQDEERIDHVLKRLYGRESNGALTLLLAANPGLAAEGPYLRRGRRLVVPPQPERQPDPGLTRPWD